MREYLYDRKINAIATLTSKNSNVFEVYKYSILYKVWLADLHEILQKKFFLRTDLGYSKVNCKMFNNSVRKKYRKKKSVKYSYRTKLCHFFLSNIFFHLRNFRTVQYHESEK